MVPFWLGLSYLSDRRQRVVFPSGKSDWKKTKAGIPQGSILGLLLFMNYINDMGNEKQLFICLFLQMAQSHIIVDLHDIAYQILNNDLQ